MVHLGSFYKRIIQTATGGTCQRFVETLELFFQAIYRQSIDRANNFIPDLDSYISLRRDTSGCKPCWALIEFANNLNLPDDVMGHPLIRDLGEATNDLVTWSNVCRVLLISFNFFSQWCSYTGYILLQRGAVQGTHSQYDRCRHERTGS